MGVKGARSRYCAGSKLKNSASSKFMEKENNENRRSGSSAHAAGSPWVHVLKNSRPGHGGIPSTVKKTSTEHFDLPTLKCELIVGKLRANRAVANASIPGSLDLAR